jgi:acyl-CoA synthetase (AMP-forming)/AMP-acid ligase II
MLPSSGTTGLPKAANFPTSRMHMLGARRSNTLGQKRGPGGDRWYVCMPMYHGTGGVHSISAIMSGVSVAIGKGFSVRNFWKDVRDSESTFIVYVGETARYLLAAPPSPLDKQHKVRVMYGNGLRPDVWRRFRERFAVPEVAEFFNSSEGMLSLFIWNRGDYTAECVGHHGALLRWFMRNTFVPVQIDYETNEIIRDSKTGWAKRNSYNEGGEIIVKLPNEQAFPGYYKNPEATKKKFIYNVFQKGDIFYRTGDALRRTDDGRWFFMDRLGDTYRWKSENVSTAEVAETLGHFHGIHEANVYGVSVPGHEGRAGCAALTIDEAARENFDWKGFAAFARQKLPRYAVPVFVRVLGSGLGSMASHNNKQDKVKLRAEGVDPGLKGSKVPSGEGDEVYWIPPKEDRYVRFEEKDWEGLVGGRARL